MTRVDQDKGAPLLDEMFEAWNGCTRCGLHKTRKNIVFGEGNWRADVLLVGEGPAEDEDKVGLPFIGDSGKILDIFLEASCLSREKDLFITNVVSCRPFIVVKTPDGKTKKENRVPNSEERAACWPRLQEIIYKVDPLIIVTMGKTPTTQVLMKKGLTMDAVRGRVQTVSYQGVYTTIRYPVLPMFHPAHLLRNQNKEYGGPWQKTSSDFLLLTSILDKLRGEYYGINPPDRESHIEAFHERYSQRNHAG